MATTNITATTAKINNYAYAPGIATYGNGGTKGETGEPGNAIFMTTYNIINGEELDDFKRCIRDRILPVRNGATIPRDYQNGDLFFDTDGNIFRITDIDRLLSYPVTSPNYKLYFMLVGKIKFNSSADRIFSKTTTGKITLNADYSGLDINNTELDINNEAATISENYALRILSDNTRSETGIIEVVQMKSFVAYDDIPELNFIYDSNTNSWHIESTLPVIIDQETKINNTAYNNLVIDGYSTVLTTETPITNFINTCRKITYTLSSDSKELTLNNFTELTENMVENTVLKLVTSPLTYSASNVYTLPLKSAVIDISNIMLSLSNNMKLCTVSLINNVECFINKQ